MRSLVLRAVLGGIAGVLLTLGDSFVSFSAIRHAIAYLALPGWFAVWILPPAQRGRCGPSEEAVILALIVNAMLYMLLFAVLPLVLRRREPLHGPRCNKCAYSLIGNESGVCPECGTKIG
jgi:hypothetical protein